jgi:ribulose-5-phosphate 4-epimerase/fuculose-1-phosphate aldolase
MTSTVTSAAAGESKAREEIARIGADLYQRRYTVGSAGNISARLGHFRAQSRIEYMSRAGRTKSC